MYVMYKSKPESRSTSGVMRDAFAKWCKGYVKDGVMYVLGDDDQYVTYQQQG